MTVVVPVTPKVGVLYVGGTIGARNLTPELFPAPPRMFTEKEVSRALRRRSDLTIAYEFVPLPDCEGAPTFPLVSSRILPEHWVSIARAIADNYDNYDGFVVLHGTDTMAWTASALSFMMNNLGKPVVVTGSQRPIRAAPSDAVPNFVNSVILAGRALEGIPLVPEVVICFGNRVVRGNRAQKVSAGSARGFDSPNAPRLGRVGRRVEITASRLRQPPAPGQRFFASLRLESRVTDIVLYPGMEPDQLSRVLEGSRGAVVRTFGTGNAHPDLGAALEQAVNAGTVIVNVTQNIEGTVESGMLSGNNALARRGVVSGLDLTYEAALTKMMVLLGDIPPDLVGRQMQISLRGEQSMDLIELSGTSPEQTEAVHRILLSESLHARVVRDRFVSAVLRLRHLPVSSEPRARAVVYLNHWFVDAGAVAGPLEPRRVGVVKLSKGSDTDHVFDVTDAARSLLLAGQPVTITVVTTHPIPPPTAELTLFMSRGGEGL